MSSNTITYEHPQLLNDYCKAYKIFEYVCAELAKKTGKDHVICTHTDINGKSITNIETTDSENNFYELLSHHDWITLANGPDEKTIPTILKLEREHL